MLHTVNLQSFSSIQIVRGGNLYCIRKEVEIHFSIENKKRCSVEDNQQDDKKSPLCSTWF